MPRQIWKIDQFHGGINNVTDPRDILDNQLEVAKNVSINQVGIITPGGDRKNSDLTLVVDNVPTEGQGLYMFYHDYAILNGDDSINPAGTHIQEGQLYIIHYASDKKVYLVQVDDNSYAYELMDFSTQSHDVDLLIIIADGKIIISDGNFNNELPAKIIRVFNFTLFEFFVSGGITHSGLGENITPPDSILAGDAWLQTYNVNSNTASVYTETLVANTILDYTFGTFTWSSDGGTVYNPYLATPLIDSIPYGQNDNDDFYSIVQFASDSSNAINMSRDITNVVGPTLYLDEPIPDGTLINYCDIYPPEGAISGWIERYSTEDPLKALEEGVWHFYYVYVFNDETISLPAKLSVWKNLNDSITEENVIESMKVLRCRITLNWPYPPGVKGMKVYMKLDERHAPAYKIADIDLQTGGVDLPLNQYHVLEMPYSSNSNRLRTEKFYITADMLIDTYVSEVGIKASEALLDVQYKTGVVVNHRLYAGNVKYKKGSGGATIAPDRLLKSSQSGIDKFDDYSILDIAIVDGDEITALFHFADRLLQYKANILYIINISQDIEFLEASFLHKGMKNANAGVETDLGIAWVNKHGVFLYDGETIHDLIDITGQRIIDWATITDENEDQFFVRYSAKDRQIIIIGKITRNIYIYDIVLKAWVSGTTAIPTNKLISNFTTDRDGNLLFIENGTTDASIKTWTSTAVQQDIEIITKDIDFGSFAQRKKIYKMYISYVGGANMNLAVKYRINRGSWTAAGTLASTSINSTIEEMLFPLGNTNSVKSLQLKLIGAVPSTFKLNDISIVYRLKGIK